MTNQLREAAERAKEFLGGLTPNSFSQPDSGLTYGQSASVYKELDAALATYAAEQLAGDGGCVVSRIAAVIKELTEEPDMCCYCGKNSQRPEPCPDNPFSDFCVPTDVDSCVSALKAIRKITTILDSTPTPTT